MVDLVGDLAAFLDKCGLPQVGMDDPQLGVMGEMGEVLRSPRAQIIDHRDAIPSLQQEVGEMRADKP
jgi:hypothetical protein